MAHDFLRTLAPHMIVGLGGPRLSAEERRLLAEYPFSGVILFERNVADARRLVELAQDVRSIFRETRGIVPLIAADHEGGVISVLGRAIGVPPTQMAVSRAGEALLCGRLFAENARRMRACGVNMLLGPVADINSEHLNPVIGTRSFGESALEASPLVSKAVSAARSGGVITCLKHFPGHGSSSVDSHLALPVLKETVDGLREKDLVPFASGIAAGAEGVMVGHIAPLGRSLPASLDAAIIQDLLRGELGFNGIVVTDALEMEGVKVAPPGEVFARALEAGNDILLFSKPVEDVVREIETLGEFRIPGASGEGEPTSSGDASLERVERLLEIAANMDREFDLPADASVYREIAEKSIRADGAQDAATATGSIGGCRLAFYSEKGEFDRFPTMSFMARLLKGLASCGMGSISTAAPEASMNEPRSAVPPSASHLECREYRCARSLRGATEAVFLLNRRPLPGTAVAELCASAQLVVVAGWPYAAGDIPPGRTVFVTCGVYDAAAEAAARLLGSP